MLLPKIGDTVSADMALKLCRHFHLEYLVRRIESNKGKYKDWKFDGCSCVHDKFLGILTGCSSTDITYQCCLPHDLGYAYGEPGNWIERKRVDLKFQQDLIHKAGIEEWKASVIFRAVRIGGIEVFGLPFSWAFASK